MIDVTRAFVRREPDVFCVTIFLAVVSMYANCGCAPLAFAGSLVILGLEFFGAAS